MSIPKAKSLAEEAVKLLEGLEQKTAPIASAQRRDGLHRARRLLQEAIAEIGVSLDI